MSSPLSLAQSLYVDGLHSIFKFLTFKQLLPVVRTCRSWSAAAAKTRSRGAACEMNPDRLALMLASPLRHMVSALTLLTHSTVPFVSIPVLAALPALTDLTMPLGPMENEANLRAALLPSSSKSSTSKASTGGGGSGSGAGAASGKKQQAGQKKPAAATVVAAVIPLATLGAQWAAGWPQRLQRLALRFQGFAPPVQLLLEVASCLPTLTDLSVEARENVPIDVAPLRRLPQLARLTFGKAIVVGPKHLQHIKQMESLKYLYINYGKWSAELLQALCGSPHKLVKLEEVSLVNTVLTSLHLLALSELPALTSLHPPRFDPTVLPLLARFGNLRGLTVRFVQTDVPAGFHQRSARLLEALVSVGPNLTEMNLEGCDLPYDQAATFLSLLPKMQVMTLKNVQLLSLAGFHSLTHLRELSIELCYSLKLEHLEELAHAPSLKCLTIGFLHYHAQLMDRIRQACLSPPLSQLTVKLVTITQF